MLVGRFRLIAVISKHRRSSSLVGPDPSCRHSPSPLSNSRIFCFRSLTAMPPRLEWRRNPAEEPGVRNPAQAQGAATFGQALDMRDSHPAEKLSTGLVIIGVTTPHGRD